NPWSVPRSNAVNPAQPAGPWMSSSLHDKPCVNASAEPDGQFPLARFRSPDSSRQPATIRSLLSSPESADVVPSCRDGALGTGKCRKSLRSDAGRPAAVLSDGRHGTVEFASQGVSADRRRWRRINLRLLWRALRSARLSAAAPRRAVVALFLLDLCDESRQS